jgi:hypothetical protein
MKRESGRKEALNYRKGQGVSKRKRLFCTGNSPGKPAARKSAAKKKRSRTAKRATSFFQNCPPDYGATQ